MKQCFLLPLYTKMPVPFFAIKFFYYLPNTRIQTGTNCVMISCLTPVLQIFLLLHRNQQQHSRHSMLLKIWRKKVKIRCQTRLKQASLARPSVTTCMALGPRMIRPRLPPLPPRDRSRRQQRSSRPRANHVRRQDRLRDALPRGLPHRSNHYPPRHQACMVRRQDRPHPVVDLLRLWMRPVILQPPLLQHQDLLRRHHL